MKRLKRNLLSAFIFAWIIAVSAVIYLLLPTHKTPFDQMVILCIIGSELLSLANVLICNAVANHKKLSLAASGYTTSAVYVILSVAVSVLFAIYYRSAEQSYLIFLTVLTSVFIIASILIYIIGACTASRAAKVEEASAAFKKLEYLIESISQSNENPAYKAKLSKIEEAIRSCDQSNYIETDYDICQCLEQLQEAVCHGASGENRIDAICDRIMALIKQRTTEVSGLKLGGI